MSASPIDVMGRPENAGAAAAGFIARLEQLKATLVQLREHESLVPPELKAQRVLETRNKLEDLGREIEIAKQGAAEWNETDAWLVEKAVSRAQVEMTEKTPFSVKKLLAELRTGTGALAQQKHNDLGPVLGTVHESAKLVGAMVAPMAGGGALGTMAATAVGAGEGLTTAAVFGGMVGGAVLAPMAIDAVTSKIESPKTQAVVKTALYALVAGGAAYLAPAAIPALIFSFGLSGAIRLINWFAGSGQAAAQPQPAPQPQAAPGRVAPQPS
ncbi:MAG: hypothetical protein HOO67_03820 [Candidatus Peribacteraceae bacterium]|nr:hypothetical protein [Candidatus Peribacteraceae bacterium]